jgi:hypothetical protein
LRRSPRTTRGASIRARPARDAFEHSFGSTCRWAPRLPLPEHCAGPSVRAQPARGAGARRVGRPAIAQYTPRFPVARGLGGVRGARAQVPRSAAPGGPGSSGSGPGAGALLSGGLRLPAPRTARCRGPAARLAAGKTARLRAGQRLVRVETSAGGERDAVLRRITPRPGPRSSSAAQPRPELRLAIAAAAQLKPARGTKSAVWPAHKQPDAWPSRQRRGRGGAGSI